MDLLGAADGVWDVGLVAVVGLAAFRLWVLLARDTITAGFRRWAAFHNSSKLSLVLHWLLCPWCAGFWIAAATFAVVEVWGDGAAVQAGVVVLALSAVVGLVAVLSKDEG